MKTKTDKEPDNTPLWVKIWGPDADTAMAAVGLGAIIVIVVCMLVSLMS